MINTYLLTEEELDALLMINNLELMAIADNEYNKELNTGLLKKFNVDFNDALSRIIDDYKFMFEFTIEKRSENILKLCHTGE